MGIHKWYLIVRMHRCKKARPYCDKDCNSYVKCAKSLGREEDND